jgi:SAM-dependent methyltransferase
VGIDLNGAQLLIRAHRSGVSFERVATLGRQGLHGHRPALISILREAGYDLPQDAITTLLSPATRYCEEFFRLLGAQEVVAIDASDYEGAQIVHDMNRPVPENLLASFDLVLDGGTLEHVFEFPTALRNATSLVRPGGRFISITMANNFCGHGFYQFSPELFYRFLSPGNGYAMESCTMWEDIPGSRFYRVPDPDSVKSRIELTSEFGTYMVVQARRLGDAQKDFIPQQSDYVRLWDGPQEATGRLARLKSRLKQDRTFAPAVAAMQKMMRLRKGAAWAAHYHRQNIRRRKQGVLTPLDGLRVMR